jgi:predicted nucleotidyltransferase component of viral defense system
VLTFTLAEVVATKIRALFQRSKGRDLFDLWLALNQLNVPSSSIVEALAARRAYREDIRPLVTAWPEGYDVDAAAEVVITDALSLIE